MRNFVESCLGGEPLLPEMSISGRQALEGGDVLLVCTDGFWANLEDKTVATAFAPVDVALSDTLASLGAQAVAAGGPVSDNTSAVALRFLE
jgi:serine/threonine protein phosphatase PrpC